LKELKRAEANKANVASFSTSVTPETQVPLGEQSGIISGDSGVPVLADDHIIAISIAGGVTGSNSQSAVSLVLHVTAPAIHQFLAEVSSKEKLKLFPE
jgi:hypothetical protein